MGILRRCAGRAATGLLASVVLAASASALETDQYYSWLRSLPDSSDAFNAKINFELESLLDEINADPARRSASCTDVREAVHERFTLFIFQKIELWAQRTAVLSRIPVDEREELEYRKNWIYGTVAWYDLSRTVPPSPTIEIDGIRLGTDKISHFFSGGHYYLDWYGDGRERGLSHEDAIAYAVKRGIAIETTVLGGVISGVISPADLEANYEGLGWYFALCDETRPLLENTASGWRLREPFDLRPYVSPEWDESYSPNVVLKGRWVHVRPQIERHCSELSDAAVQARRERYAARDKATYTEAVLAQMIRDGRFEDPRDYSIERLCEAKAAAAADVATGPPQSTR